jgi:hypothetical protein
VAIAVGCSFATAPSCSLLHLAKERIRGMKTKAFISLISLLILIDTTTHAAVPGSPFTYQGRLIEGEMALDGSCDLRFHLFDAETGGNLLETRDVPGAVVQDGLFTVVLDFGPGFFQGEARWLEISVRHPSGAGDYTPLVPRQSLTAVPYALYAARAGEVAVLETRLAAVESPWRR